MNIQLIQGQYSPADALNILTQMVHVKIKFHESKISITNSEEDIKMREKRIRQLQNDLYEVRRHIESGKGNVSLDSVISL